MAPSFADLAIRKRKRRFDLSIDFCGSLKCQRAARDFDACGKLYSEISARPDVQIVYQINIIYVNIDLHGPSIFGYWQIT